jgi:hypothetical protein
MFARLFLYGRCFKISNGMCILNLNFKLTVSSDGIEISTTSLELPFCNYK